MNNIIEIPITLDHLSRAVRAVAVDQSAHTQHCVFAQAARDVIPETQSTGTSSVRVSKPAASDSFYDRNKFFHVIEEDTARSSDIVLAFDRAIDRKRNDFSEVAALLPTVIRVRA